MADERNRKLLGVFSAIYGDLLAYVSSRFGPAVDADDVLQDTFLRLQRVPAETAIENPRSYLFRVADNLAMDHLRGRSARVRRFTSSELQEDPADSRPSPERIIDYRQRIALLNQAIAELPQRQRQVFVMHKFDGLTHAQIALELGITKSAVEKHIMKALSHCRDRLGDLIDPH